MADATPEIKQYALFAGRNYYPKGGWNDFVGFYGSPETAIAAGRDMQDEPDDWWHVVDWTTGSIVADDCVDWKKGARLVEDRNPNA